MKTFRTLSISGLVLAMVLLVNPTAHALQYEVTSTINVPSSPYNTAIAPNGSTLAVSAAFDPKLMFINLSNQSVIQTVILSARPIDLVYSLDGTVLYVLTEDYPAKIVKINTTNYSVTSFATLNWSCNPNSLTITVDGAYLYVNCGGAYSGYEQVRSADGAVTDIFAPLSSDASGIFMSRDGSAIFSTHSGSSTISRFDLTSFTSTQIPAGNTSLDVVQSIDGTLLFTADYYTHEITVVDVSNSNVVQTIQLPQNAEPEQLEVTPNGKQLLATDPHNGKAIIIDIDSFAIVAMVSVGDTPISVSVTPNGSFAYVTNVGDDSVTVIDLRTPVTSPVSNTDTDQELAKTGFSQFDLVTSIWAATTLIMIGLLAIRKKIKP